MALYKHPQLPSLLSLRKTTYIITVVVSCILFSFSHFAEAVLASLRFYNRMRSLMRWSQRDSSTSQGSCYTRMSGAMFLPPHSSDSRLSSWCCWGLASWGLFVSQRVIHWLYFPAKRALQIIIRKDEWDGMGWLTRISKMGQQSGQPSTTAWRVRQSCSHLPSSRSVINDYLYLYISHSTTKLCFHSLSFSVVVKFLISLQ